MTEQSRFPGSQERRIPDPAEREAEANGVLGVAAGLHRQEVLSRLGQLPAGTDLLEVPGPHLEDLRRAHARAILADTDGGSYQERRDAEPFVRSQPGDPAPFPGGVERPVQQPAGRPQQ